MTAEDKLAALGLTLPEASAPKYTYRAFKRDGNTVYISGQGPMLPDGTRPTGKVGADVTAEEAVGHAQLTGLQLLAVAKAAAGGDLDKVEFLKLLGMVNAAPDFGDMPKVINGCSDLLVAVLGERGAHARSAVGMGSLPGGMTVEIEAVIKIHE